MISNEKMFREKMSVQTIILLINIINIININIGIALAGKCPSAQVILPCDCQNVSKIVNN